MRVRITIWPRLTCRLSTSGCGSVRCGGKRYVVQDGSRFWQLLGVRRWFCFAREAIEPRNKQGGNMCAERHPSAGQPNLAFIQKTGSHDLCSVGAWAPVTAHPPVCPRHHTSPGCLGQPGLLNRRIDACPTQPAAHACCRDLILIPNAIRPGWIREQDHGAEEREMGKMPGFGGHLVMDVTSKVRQPGTPHADHGNLYLQVDEKSQCNRAVRSQVLQPTYT